MKHTTVKLSEIKADPNHRLDAAYWIAKHEAAKPDCAEQCGAYKPEHCDEEGNCDHRIASYDVPNPKEDR